MLLILVRHGETIWNKQRKHQGWLDSPLTQKGEEEAGEIALCLKDYRIDELYSSPLGRAVATAKIICKENKCTAIEEPLLKEKSYGAIEGLSLEAAIEKFPDEVKKRESDKYNYNYPGGESYREMNEKRIKPFIKKTIEPNIGSKKTIVVVSHSGPGKLIIGDLLGLGESETISIVHPNDCIYFIELAKGRKPVVSYLRASSGKRGEGYLTDWG